VLVLTVALTGGIGSGKSTAGELFAELGAIVVDSDQLARDVIERGTPGFEALLDAFGDSILSDGEIDRSKLAADIFSDSEKRKVAEKIIHPLVRDAWDAYVRGAPEDSIMINLIPILVETGSQKRFDKVVTISAEEDIRVKRAIARGLHEYDVRRRMQAQASDTDREKIADFIIHNEGTFEELEEQVRSIWAELR
jgi:dephospho-CoA kinase